MIKLYLKKGWNFVSFPSNDISTVISNPNVVEIKDLKSTWNRSVPSFFNTLKQFEYNKMTLKEGKRKFIGKAA